MKKLVLIRSGLILSLLVTALTACGSEDVSPQPQFTAPGISLEITGNECPSVEIEAGMEISWTNKDTVDHLILVERTNDQGVVVESSGTDLLQPGSTFSIRLMNAGRYKYYCSLDLTRSGTINVSAGE